jgi:hypothetical protein
MPAGRRSTAYKMAIHINPTLLKWRARLLSASSTVPSSKLKEKCETTESTWSRAYWEMAQTTRT